MSNELKERIKIALADKATGEELTALLLDILARIEALENPIP